MYSRGGRDVRPGHNSAVHHIADSTCNRGDLPALAPEVEGSSLWLGYAIITAATATAATTTATAAETAATKPTNTSLSMHSQWFETKNPRIVLFCLDVRWRSAFGVLLFLSLGDTPRPYRRQYVRPREGAESSYYEHLEAARQ